MACEGEFLYRLFLYAFVRVENATIQIFFVGMSSGNAANLSKGTKCIKTSALKTAARFYISVLQNLLLLFFRAYFRKNTRKPDRSDHIRKCFL